jgi:hypothetical protein
LGRRLSDEPIEWVEQQIGTGDGCTVCFIGTAPHRPIEQDTLKVFIVPNNALDAILGLEGRKAIDPAQVMTNQNTGVITVNLYVNGIPTPLAIGDALWIRYQWRPPRLRDARIRVMIKGKKEWVSVRELQDAFNRSDRPWPDEPGGKCRGPCRH